MAIRVSRLLVAAALCALPGCVDPRLPPYVALPDRATKADELQALAEQGNALDQYNLGVRYEKAQGVRQDFQEAARWYRLAAMQGSADAQYKLCAMSDFGRGLLQDDQEALRWCGLAADQGEGFAMYTIGLHYHTGRGVSPDWVRAYMWYNLAAAHGVEQGAIWRDRLTYVMAPTQIAEAQKLAREWRAERH